MNTATTICDTPTIKSVVVGSRVFSLDKQYNFQSMFDMKNGMYVRSGIYDNGKETEQDPFMGSMPSLLDIGIMGHCIHGKSGKCLASGVECYQNGRDIHMANMEVKDFAKIIGDIRGKTFQVALGGRGDPNKHEHFEEILKICRDNYVVPNFTTSGFGLTDSEVAIAEKYCGAVAVSEYRNEYTGIAIKKFVDAGMIVNLHYVLGNQSIDDAIDRLERSDFYQGLNAVIFLAHKPVGLGTKHNVLSAHDPRISRFFQLVDDKKQPFKLGFDSCNVPGIINYTKNIDLMSVDACEASRFSAYCTADMKMLPCSFDVGGMKWAIDLYTNTVEEAWNSLLFENFRDSFRKSCPGCGKRENCFGGCPITNEITLCTEKNK